MEIAVDPDMPTYSGAWVYGGRYHRSAADLIFHVAVTLYIEKVISIKA
jgi:hypothetical protein